MSARQEKGVVLFLVRDTGIGISPEHLERIFAPFWQVQQTASRRVGGAGLGLSVSRQLTEKLGGSLSVQSAVGSGSIFTVRLPLRLARGGYASPDTAMDSAAAAAP